MNDGNEVDRLKDLTCEMRKKLLYLCDHYKGSVHTGDDLSVAGPLAGLFHHGLHMDPENISMEDRDRFILSKSHRAVYMCIAMAMRGFFDYGEILSTYGELDSALGMYPCKVQLPGVECSTGSLEHRLPMTVGMVLSARYKKQGHRVFYMLGNGETTEGSMWEAALTAPPYKLGNLVTLIDRNKQFITMFSEEPIVLEPYGNRWKSFDWDVKEVDGHDITQIINALDSLSSCDSHMPAAIVCHIVKEKGVSFMERNIDWHAGLLSLEDMEQAIVQIDAARCRGGNMTS